MRIAVYGRWFWWRLLCSRGAGARRPGVATLAPALGKTPSKAAAEAAGAVAARELAVATRQLAAEARELAVATRQLEAEARELAVATRQLEAEGLGRASSAAGAVR